MEMTTRTKGSVYVLDLDGRLVGTDATALYQKTSELLSRGVTQVLINLEQIDLMDSSGLGELARAKKAADARGATIKLLHVGRSVRQVLEITRSIDAFEIFDDEAKALASFRG